MTKPMTFDGFKASLRNPSPPDALSLPLQALWYESTGDWDQAHTAAQQADNTDGAWVHAYLHRVEGDLSNARYWYRRADKPESTATLAEEWSAIVRTLLSSAV